MIVNFFLSVNLEHDEKYDVGNVYLQVTLHGFIQKKGFANYIKFIRF